MVWHQHQPYYKMSQTGNYLLPWVRLHCTKDYLDMVSILDNYPKIRQTFNISPSLMEQILDYSEKGAKDKFLEVSRKPAKELLKDEKIFILKNFFMVNPDTMIYPFPRYSELFRRRGWFISDEYLSRIEPLFTPSSIRDIVVWFNMSWVDPYFRETNEKIRKIFKKGKDFSEDEKNILLDEMANIIKEVLPKHKELQNRGQIEVSTTPFYHPILPLLIDTNIARRGMPFVCLPKSRFQQPDDAETQIQLGIELYKNIFGVNPRGMWPSEGSVSPAIVPMMERNAIKWIATDEEILFKSLPRNGGVMADALYKPYKVVAENSSVNIVFRDHKLSDLIGFVYYKMDPAAAANDFVNRIKKIQELLSGNGYNNNGIPNLVSVILDGENCWEYYKNDGRDFLNALYAKLSSETDIITTTVSDFIEKYPPKDVIPNLFPGSWINGNFGIWIGHNEDNTAWDLLNQTRKFLVSKIEQKPTDVIEKAWKEIYIAEGSDWNWWYGNDHSSANDAEFDMLFRTHLINVYKILDEKVPNNLFVAIKKRGELGDIVKPVDFIHPVLDGKISSYFEWHNAGFYDISKAGGTMHQTDTYLRSIHWGFDMQNMYLRIDYNALYPAKDINLKITFIKPVEKSIKLDADNGVLWDHKKVDTKSVDFCFGNKGVVEIAVSFDLLAAKIGDNIEFVVIAEQNNMELERWPYRSSIGFTRPDANFNESNW